MEGRRICLIAQRSAGIYLPYPCIICRTTTCTKVGCMPLEKLLDEFSSHYGEKDMATRPGATFSTPNPNASSPKPQQHELDPYRPIASQVRVRPFLPYLLFLDDLACITLFRNLSSPSSPHLPRTPTSLPSSASTMKPTLPD